MTKASELVGQVIEESLYSVYLLLVVLSSPLLIRAQIFASRVFQSPSLVIVVSRLRARSYRCRLQCQI